MADFKVEVLPLVVRPHPDPATTALEVGQIGGYNIVIRKGAHKTGDLVAYIPEASIVPDALLAELGLTGRLAGSAKNRVKAIKLRGVMSQGIVCPAKPEWKPGQDVTAELGITKYDPPIPTHMRGEMNSSDITFSFDIENIKKYPDVLQEGEEVVFTEKIHGTFMCIGRVHESKMKEDMVDGAFFVSSKGLAKSGLYIKDNEQNANNTYLKAVRAYELTRKLEEVRRNFLGRPCKQWGPLMNGETIWLCGEVYGVQKGYGYGASGASLGFRAFGIKIGNEWVNRELFDSFCEHMEIPKVPELYRGPYSKAKVAEFTSGKETVTGRSEHIREGIVINTVPERSDYHLGRVILKSVSDEYLGKSDGEEFN